MINAIKIFGIITTAIAVTRVPQPGPAPTHSFDLPRFEEERRGLSWADFSPDNKLFAVRRSAPTVSRLDGDRMRYELRHAVTVWNTADWEDHRDWNVPAGGAGAAEFHSCVFAENQPSQVFSYGALDRESLSDVSLLDLTAVGRVLPLRSPKCAASLMDKLVAIAPSADGKTLFSLGVGHGTKVAARCRAQQVDDGSNRLRPPAQQMPPDTETEYSEGVAAIALSPAAGYYAVAALVRRNDSMATVRLEPTPGSGKPPRELGTSRAPDGLEFSRDGSLIANRGHDGSVVVWRTADGTLSHNFPASMRTITGLSFSGDNRYLAFTSTDKPGSGDLFVADLTTDKIACRMETDDKRGTALARISPDGKTLVAVTRSGMLKVYAMADLVGP